MTKEQQRIAIAKACPNAVEWHDGIPYWKGSWSAAGEGNEHFALFDPPNDLNAMHEAENGLDDAEHYNFRVHLWEVTKAESRHAGMDLTHNRNYASATAAHRAEAFLRTLNLWAD